MVQDAAFAEDISQEVFLTVYKSVGGFTGKSSLSTWIYRITVNKCIDHLRSRKRQSGVGFFSSFRQSGDAESWSDLHANFEHPGIVAERKELAELLFRALETLPESQKTVFVMSQIEELPQREIADILNISVKAMESLLQRAKANLRIKLAPVYERRKPGKHASNHE